MPLSCERLKFLSALQAAGNSNLKNKQACRALQAQFGRGLTVARLSVSPLRFQIFETVNLKIILMSETETAQKGGCIR
jgi:hypothetical protein